MSSNLFSPKVLAMKGLDLEPTTASRTIICKMVPKLESEEELKFADGVLTIKGERQDEREEKEKG